MRFAIFFSVKYLFSRIILALVLSSLPIGVALLQAAEQKQSEHPAMSFIIVRRAVCNQPCPEWISAEGRITSDTPAQMRKILKKIGNRKLPIVFRSEGGDVNAAYAMGRMIRKAGLETAVGGTRLEGCPPEDLRCAAAIARNGAPAGSTYSYGAYCVSACPLALAGGTTRVSSQWAYIGVHQITTVYNKMRVSYRIEYKMVNGKKQEVSRKEIGRKVTGQSSSTKLGKKATATLKAYLKEMGVSDDIVDLMMRAAPDSMMMVAPTDALRTGLLTDMLAYNEWPGMPLCAQDAAADAVCYRHPAPKAAVAEVPVKRATVYPSYPAPKTHPMDFLLMYNGNCQEECTQWISADGDIMPDTPAQLDAILKTLGDRKLPVVFQSFGGDKDAAFAMGRMIRAAGLDTSIGRTRLPNCPMQDPRCTASMAKSGPTEGEVFAGGAYCFSSCTLAFMGGTSRLVGRTSALGISQPASKVTETERGKFIAYFSEMGISPETFDTMMITPSFGRGDIYPPQALKLDIIDGVIPYDEEPGLHFCGPNAKESVRCPRRSGVETVPVAATVN
ncbi:hypothetical protein [Rhizobium sp. CF142]|uniref:COG3904 family protein n=1 Tax=Rhizobium sp. CF142 TaxID=1144314 RepID=UPI00026EF6F3|nr:hypothetical protein [Rhizobium sp. CF142]EJJ25986.1 putative periplasmic protein [Rhizobium sp. CF142]